MNGLRRWIYENRRWTDQLDHHQSPHQFMFRQSNTSNWDVELNNRTTTSWYMPLPGKGDSTRLLSAWLTDLTCPGDDKFHYDCSTTRRRQTDETSDIYWLLSISSCPWLLDGWMVLRKWMCVNWWAPIILQSECGRVPIEFGMEEEEDFAVGTLPGNMIVLV